MAEIKSNELLCYLTQQFTKDSADDIKNAILSSFDGEEITIAKNTLFKDYKDILGKSVPRKDSSKRTQAMADLDDIFDALSKMDSNKKLPIYSATIISKLPGYAAPSVKANGELFELVNLMADRIKAMEGTLINVQKLILNHLPQCGDKVNAIFNHVMPTYADTTAKSKSATTVKFSSPPTGTSKLAKEPLASKDDVSTPSADTLVLKGPEMGANSSPSNVIAEVVDRCETITHVSNNTDGFQLQKQEARRLRRREILIGKKQSDNNSKLRGGPMPRRDYYVSRLHVETKVDDIQDHLSGKGITPIEVTDLTKEGHQLRSFKVSINICDNHSFLDGEIWPFGVMVRRYFPPRSASNNGVSLSTPSVS